MNFEEIFIYTFESQCNSELTIFDIECAYKNGKDVLQKIQVISPFEDQDQINFYLNDHKKVIPENLFEIAEIKRSPDPFQNFEYIFHFKNYSWLSKMQPVSEKFISFLKSQNIFKRISEKIPLNDFVVEEHLILVLRGVFCDDDQGYIDCVIQGAKTPLMLTWENTRNDLNVYPGDITFDDKLLVFKVPDFDPTDFIDYVKSIKK